MFANRSRSAPALQYARGFVFAAAMGGACAAASWAGMPGPAMPEAPQSSSTAVPTAAACPPNATVLFDGKDLSKWKHEDGRPANWKVVDGGAFEVGNGDLVSRESLAGDFVLHVEFCVPAMPKATGQAKGNSGVFLADCFELQILDSLGITDLGLGDCAAVYGKRVPTKNAAKAAGEWQTFEAHYQAPRWDAGGNKTKPARLTLWWNGDMVHDNVELDGPCPGARPESPHGGPIRLEDHGNPVRFRNIWVAPLGAAKS